MPKDRSKKKPIKKYPPNKGSQPAKQVKKNRYSEVVGLGIIILLGIIIYSDSFDCSFHFDDYPQIVNNTKIQNLQDVQAWWNSSPNRPISTFTFALNYHFNQLDVRYYHLFNLIIHLINACLVWWLTLLIFSSPALKDNPIIRQKKVIAFFTALLFVSHPLATQSVTYIVQRMTSMAAMFYLLSLILYVKARLSNKVNITKTLLFTGSLISAVLAMLTKENAFTLPFAIVLFEFFFLRVKKQLSINFRDYRLLFLMAIFLGVILIIPLKYSFTIFKPIPPSLGNAYTVTSLNYLLTQFSVIIKYIQLLFLPINQNLDYDFPVSNSFFDIKTLLSFLVLLSLIILAIFFFKKYRIISFGIFWFFLTLSIESSFIPINDVIYEHRTYLPSFGFFLIITSGIYYLLWNKHKYIAISILVIIIASNSWLTYERNKVWKDDLILWNDTVLKNPNKARPFSNRGNEYWKLGQSDQALADFSEAIRIDSNYADAFDNRGVVYCTLRQYDKSIADLSRAIKLYPEFAKAYNNRGITYMNLRQWNKAIADYSMALKISHNFTDGYFNRGAAYYLEGKLDSAIADFSKVIEIDPKYAKAYFNRGVAYANLDHWDKAIDDFSSTIEIDHNFTDAYFNRGVAYGNLGQWQNSITDYSMALKIDPNNTNAYSNREIAYKNLTGHKK
jgi:tetratricopeptide (TPR) repeat protein